MLRRLLLGEGDAPGLAEPATFQECRERAPRQLDAAEDQRETGLWSANTSTLLNAP